MIFIALILVTLVAFYFYNTRNFNYWTKRRVKHPKPVFLFGTNGKTYLMQKSMTQTLVDGYRSYPTERVVGGFKSSKPILIIRDPELIKRVVATDFAHFSSRGLNQHEEVVEPLLRNLFFVDGDLWRLLRQRMTPAFTSGKLRAMFPLIVERAQRLRARALAAAAARRPADARDLMARYTTDFIGACGFGLDADSLNEDDSAFRKLGAKIFNFRLQDVLLIYLKDIFPGAFKDFRVLGKVEDEISDLVKAILRTRNYKPSGRNDFIDLLLECKSKGVIRAESLYEKNADGSPAMAELEIDDVLMVAQVFIFFAAGFETSSSATSYTLHELAFNQNVQKKLQKEIDLVLAEYNGELSYDSIKKMTYLEWTFMEGMRKFPSLGFLMRKCTKPYTFPELNISIDKGVQTYIPVQALQMDPRHFDNPEEFRPERFSPDVFDSSKMKYIYMPFGVGPRACIGERLGLMQSLAGLAAILSRFTVHPAPETIRHPKINPASGIVQSVKGGLPLIFQEREIHV